MSQFVFSKTSDRELIRSIAAHPLVYRYLHDDAAPPIEEWEPIDHPLVGYVTIMQGQELLGLFIVSAHSSVQWEVHNAILPHVGWKRRLKIAQEFFEWLRSCGCKRVIAKVVMSNRYSLKFTEAAGMKRFGINEKSFMRGAILQDEVYFGLSL